MAGNSKPDPAELDLLTGLAFRVLFNSECMEINVRMSQEGLSS
jgi:hypothetical protein